MNPLISALIASTIRKLLTLLAGVLIAHNIATASQAEGLVQLGVDWGLAILPLAISAFWSYANEKGWRVKFLTALWLPEGSTENDVKEIIKSGAVTPTVTTPPDTIPGIPKPTDQP